MGTHSRPRPSAIDLLPEECEGVVAWAAQELANTSRPQTEIYRDFSARLEEIKAQTGLQFATPHYSSFTRHNLNLTRMLSRQKTADRMAAAVIDKTDEATADQLTRASTRMLKTMIVEMMIQAEEGGLPPKELKNAAAAIHQISQAELASTNRRQRLEEEKNRALKIAEAAADAMVEAGKPVDKETVLEMIREAYGV